MIFFVNIRRYPASIILFLFLTGNFYGQEETQRKMKVEVAFKGRQNSCRYRVNSVSMSLIKSVSSSDVSILKIDQSAENKKYMLSMDFEKIETSLLKLITDDRSELSGEITVSDESGSQPARKIEFRGATLNSLSDQFSGDYSSAFIYLWCKEMTVDGVKLK